MTCVRRNLNNRACCNSWQKGIRTINNQYPDDNREFEIAAGNGISVVPITAGILITNTSAASSFVEGRNINITPSGTDLQISVKDQPEFDGLTVNGTSTFNGDIIQNGAAYETHAEKVYTTNDYIIMRDGAVAGLGTGDYSGFQVKLYDGVNDGRLVIDKDGVARVGDVGDEQPLLTRNEDADLTDGALFKWDATNYKAINEGTVGSDTKPLKSVNGVLTPVSDTLAKASSVPVYAKGTSGSFSCTSLNVTNQNVSFGTTLGRIPEVVITLAGLPVGSQYLTYSAGNITASGFTIQVFNSSSSDVSGVIFRYVALG